MFWTALWVFLPEVSKQKNPWLYFELLKNNCAGSCDVSSGILIVIQCFVSWASPKTLCFEPSHRHSIRINLSVRPLPNRSTISSATVRPDVVKGNYKEFLPKDQNQPCCCCCWLVVCVCVSYQIKTNYKWTLVFIAPEGFINNQKNKQQNTSNMCWSLLFWALISARSYPPGDGLTFIAISCSVEHCNTNNGLLTLNLNPDPETGLTNANSKFCLN